MTTKKSANIKKATSKTTLIKIAEAVGSIAGEISVKKDQLTNMASGAIDSVKATIQDIGKKTAKVKSGSRVIQSKVKAAKKVAGKAATPATRKTTTKKVSPVEKIKPVAKKAAPKKELTTKKAATAKNGVVLKKATKPVAKKTAKK